MICPKCGGEHLLMLDSREPSTKPYRRRRYECTCGERFTMREILVEEHERLLGKVECFELVVKTMKKIIPVS